MNLWFDFFLKPIRSVNTDEPVAYGAAVQGAVLSGAHHIGKVLVVDINSFTLWFETTKKNFKDAYSSWLENTVRQKPHIY